MMKEKLEKYNPLKTDGGKKYGYNMEDSFLTEQNQVMSEEMLEGAAFGMIKNGNYTKVPFLYLKEKIDKSELKELSVDIRDMEFIAHNDMANTNSIRIHIGFLVNETVVDLDMESCILRDIPWISKQVEAFISDEGNYAFITLIPMVLPILLVNGTQMPKSSRARLALYKFDGNIYVIICDEKSIIFVAGKVAEKDKKEIYQLLKYATGIDEVTSYSDSII